MGQTVFDKIILIIMTLDLMSTYAFKSYTIPWAALLRMC